MITLEQAKALFDKRGDKLQNSIDAAGLLDKALLSEKCTELVVMAEPHFLGLMNKELSPRVRAAVLQEVPREWSQGSDKELEEYLREKMA